MSNANEPAYPGNKPMHPGLTKREYFAAMAMQGIFANPNWLGDSDERARDAIEAADALLRELEK